MKFVKQLNLAIQHEYFSPGADPGLSIRPTEACGQLLKRFGLLVKTSIDELNIFGDETPHADRQLPADIPFDFLVFSGNQFSQYTALGNKNSDEIYLFSNKTADSKSTAKLVTSVISGAEFGAYPGEPILGVARLWFNAAIPMQLTLKFTARAIKWKYYVVTNPARASLVVDGTLSGTPFSRKENVKKSPDAIISALTSNYPVATVAFFESDKAIGLSSLGRKNIQLKNEQSNTVVIRHLPNPALHDNGIQIINLLD